MRWLPLIVLLGFVWSCSSAAAALPPDSHAPPGASPNWLPSDEWVMERWMPFEEKALTQTMRMSREEIYEELKLRPKNLAEIARERGIALSAKRLLASRRTRVKGSRWHDLVRRAELMLSQRHLAEHVIGHTFHHDSIWRDPEAIWGPTFHALWSENLAISEISRRSGIPLDVLRRRVLAALDRGVRRGVSTQAMTAEHGRALQTWHRTYITELVPDGSGAMRMRSRAAGASDSAWLCPISARNSNGSAGER